MRPKEDPRLFEQAAQSTERFLILNRFEQAFLGRQDGVVNDMNDSVWRGISVSIIFAPSMVVCLPWVL